MTQLNLSSLGPKQAQGLRPTVLSSLDYAKIFLVFAGFIFSILLVFLTFAISPVFGLILVVVIFAFMKNKETELKKREVGRFNKLISDNNWLNDQKVPEEIMVNFALLNNGSSDAKGIKGSIQDKDFWLLSDEGGAITIIDTKKQLPEAYFLSSVINSGLSMRVFDSMMKEEKLERISLEGDFNNHFRLYIRPGSQIDVLSVVSPDLMDAMLTKQGISNAIFKNSCICISSFSGTDENIRSLLEASESLLSEI
jgi:hypothetical protein